MSDQEQIHKQQVLLARHRQRLHYLLQQLAILGSGYIPPGVAYEIDDARSSIHRIKELLRGWGVFVVDEPDDIECLSYGSMLSYQVAESREDSDFKPSQLTHEKTISLPNASISCVKFGMLEGEYKYSPSVVGFMFVFSGIIVVFSWGYSLIFTRTSSIAVQLGLIVGLFCVGIGLAILSSWWKKHNVRLLISDERLKYLEGDKEIVLGWAEIDEVIVSVGEGNADSTISSFSCIGNDKLIVVDSDIEEFNRIYAVVQQEIMKSLIIRAIDVYNTGGSLYFGSIVLDWYGVIINKRKVSWDLIDAIDDSNGAIWLSECGKSKKQLIAKISETPIFLSLLSW